MTGDRPIDEGKGVGRETCPRQAREVVERTRDAAGARAREIGGIGKNRQEHVRRMKDNVTEAMTGDEAQEALQPFHGAERRRGLLARESTGCLEDSRVHQPSVVHQVANGYLNVLTLGG